MHIYYFNWNNICKPFVNVVYKLKNWGPNRLKSYTPLKPVFEHDEVIKQTIPLFLKHLRSASLSLESDALDQDWQRVLTTTHKLKGSAGSYGYPDIVDLTIEIEHEVRNSKRLNNIIKHIEKFTELTHRVEAGF